MKKNDKNKEKKQRVRVLETGELGTVTDQQLIPRQGQLHVYRQVRLDGRPHLDRWYWDDQLGGTTEIATATIACGGQAVTINVTQDYETDNMSIDMTGSPENLKAHNRLHMAVAVAIFAGLGLKPEDVVTE